MKMRKILATLAAAAVACSAMAVSAFAALTNANDGTANYMVDVKAEGFTADQIYGVKAVLSGDLSSGAGGAVVANHVAGWDAVEFGTGDDKAIKLEADGTLEYLGEDPMFDEADFAEEGYAQAVIAWYWGADLTVHTIELLDADGSVLKTYEIEPLPEDEPAEDEPTDEPADEPTDEPAEDEPVEDEPTEEEPSDDNVQTGATTGLALAAIALAGAAVVATKKQK